MHNESSTQPKFAGLWLRFACLGIVGVVFAGALELASGKILGWTFYLTPGEVVFEAVVRLVFAGLVGVLLGTVAAILVAVLYFSVKPFRERIFEISTGIAVVAVVFFSSKMALFAFIKSTYQLGEHRGVFDNVIRGLFYLSFVAALCLPRSRYAITTSLNAFLKRRVAGAVVAITAASAFGLAGFEYALARSAAAVSANATSMSARPKTNIVLITFDALSAEDMSAYGYKLPTTPNIDAFAQSATIFRNYYAASTFTTPCLSTVMTGMYPSQTHVHQLQGVIKDREKNLPHLLRAAGYTTASFLSNPYAYYLAASVRNEFQVLPEPIFQDGGVRYLWSATAPLHQDSGFGSRVEEYRDLAKFWNPLVGAQENLHEQYRATTTFENAAKILATLPDGFFLWIHVMTPHGPYLPEPQERGQFVPAHLREIFEGSEQPRWKPHYQPSEQSEVDRYRLRYDEFIRTADRAFGTFISELDRVGKSQNTAVVVSADHGESFEGGNYQHGHAEQTRPVVHVPLIIRTPNQQVKHDVAVVADESSLAPTLLELADIPKPAWMEGQSLADWLDGVAEWHGPQLAFTQHLEKNSIFKPLRHGTVGVIDGEYQYVYDLDTKKGSLRPLPQAQYWNLDMSADNPARTNSLRAAISSRFPRLGQTE